MIPKGAAAAAPMHLVRPDSCIKYRVIIVSAQKVIEVVGASDLATTITWHTAGRLVVFDSPSTVGPVIQVRYLPK
jgi:hypothetical protein